MLASRPVATEESSLTNFGLLIAYVLPGFTALEGFPLITPSRTAWGTTGDPNPTLTAFLSGTVMALAAGLTVSTVRWLVIDAVHHRTGLRRPARDFARLEKSVAAAEYLDLVHYSGRRGVSPRPSPLRTGRATFIASGSSKSLTTRSQT